MSGRAAADHSLHADSKKTTQKQNNQFKLAALELPNSKPLLKHPKNVMQTLNLFMIGQTKIDLVKAVDL